MKMLSEYIDMNNCFPVLSSEVVHRIVEILKFFNTRTCQLVLGAGAMQVLTVSQSFDIAFIIYLYETATQLQEYCDARFP